MARSLHKVQKQISKKRGGKPNALHENSRDARRLRTAGAREEKIAKLLDAATKANQVYVDRVGWFQSELENTSSSLSDEDIHQLVEKFVHRIDSELADAKAERRPGRPATKAEKQIQQIIDAESREYKAGLWTPEVRTDEGRKRLERWSGDWAGLNSLHFVRVIRDGQIKSSSFPPKALS